MSAIAPQQLIRQRNRFANHYGQQAELIHLISQRLLERLELVTITPQQIVTLASADGATCRQLKTFYRSASIIGIESAHNLIKLAKDQVGWFDKQRYLCAMPEQTPLGDDSVDLVVTNLYPLWQSDLNPLFAEVNRILKPDGLFLFTSLGPDSLSLVRESWQQADPDYAHLLDFIDMHDIGDALTRCRFHNIVMENEPLTIEYEDIKSLHQDLRLTAHANLANNRRQHLTGKNRFLQYTNYLQQKMNPSLNITYDVIFGHGWKGKQIPKHAINAIPENYQTIPTRALD